MMQVLSLLLSILRLFFIVWRPAAIALLLGYYLIRYPTIVLILATIYFLLKAFIFILTKSNNEQLPVKRNINSMLDIIGIALFCIQSIYGFIIGMNLGAGNTIQPNQFFQMLFVSMLIVALYILKPPTQYKEPVFYERF